MALSESENRLMRGEVGLEHRDSDIQRGLCGSSVSEAVETKSFEIVVPDTSRGIKPVKGLKEGLNVTSFWGP